jgi:CCR4-NOT transcriptional regulation complex NOT5 subunit
MKLRTRNVVWLLPFLLTACFHKKHQQPVQSLAPSAETSAKPEPTSPPTAGTNPSQPAKASTGTKHSPKPPVRHKKPAGKTAQPMANNVSVANSEISASRVMGQLSSGNPSDLRRETVDSMAGTERGLNGIGHSLNGQEQKTATQIRIYLKQAREALSNGDADGAHTLAAKARVLLGELRR